MPKSGLIVRFSYDNYGEKDNSNYNEIEIVIIYRK